MAISHSRFYRGDGGGGVGGVQQEPFVLCVDESPQASKTVLCAACNALPGKKYFFPSSPIQESFGMIAQRPMIPYKTKLPAAYRSPFRFHRDLSYASHFRFVPVRCGLTIMEVGSKNHSPLPPTHTSPFFPSGDQFMRTRSTLLIIIIIIIKVNFYIALFTN